MTPRLSNTRRHRLHSDHFDRVLGAPVCLLCGAAADQAGLCKACRASLPWLPAERCPTCAAPTPGGLTCGQCLKRSPVPDRVEAALIYAFPADALVHALKYGHRLAAATVLGHVLLDSVDQAPRPDLVVPLPLSEARLRERGFNQALEIARVVAKGLRLPLQSEACRRVRDTPPQASLPFGERRKNVRGAFVCDADLDGARVALVDDVLTTGASLDACARVLRKAGALEVTGWVVARTLLEA